jgi:PKD repeat protein
MLNSLKPLFYEAVETNPTHTFAANHEKEVIATVGRNANYKFCF